MNNNTFDESHEALDQTFREWKEKNKSKTMTDEKE